MPYRPPPRAGAAETPCGSNALTKWGPVLFVAGALTAVLLVTVLGRPAAPAQPPGRAAPATVGGLGDVDPRVVAPVKAEGHSNGAIAAQVGSSSQQWKSAWR